MALDGVLFKEINDWPTESTEQDLTAYKCNTNVFELSICTTVRLLVKRGLNASAYSIDPDQVLQSAIFNAQNILPFTTGWFLHDNGPVYLIPDTDCNRGKSFPKQALVFTCLQYESFENSMNGEITRNEQFLLLQQSFLLIWRTFCHFCQLWICYLQPLSVWKSC